MLQNCYILQGFARNFQGLCKSVSFVFKSVTLILKIYNGIFHFPPHLYALLTLGLLSVQITNIKILFL